MQIQNFITDPKVVMTDVPLRGENHNLMKVTTDFNEKNMILKKK